MPKSTKKIPIIAIVGPTASGKSALAVQLAKKIHGEIISADSRQIFRGMNIGTGKITKREQKNIPHHLLDVASPKKRYTISHFIKDANRAIAKISANGKIPLIVGGTGFWIDAVLQGQRFPNVKPNQLLRKKLGKKRAEELFKLLQKKDPKRAKVIDRHNPYRLVRALEIIAATGKPVPKQKPESKYEPVYIGIKLPKRMLHRRILTRLQKRMKYGMIAEVQKLHADGVSWKRLEEFGLEYRFVSQYLQHKIAKQRMMELLETAILHYAKRQMTWLKRNSSIHWVKNMHKANAIIQKQLATM